MKPRALKAKTQRAKMTYNSITKALRDAGIENAEREAAILIEHFLGIPYSKLVIMKDCELARHEELEKALEKRTEHFPLQYIIGKWYFMDEVYEVTPDVLVPRDDTEVLVRYGIENLPEHGRFADLCTGSGCVAISLLTKRKDALAVAAEKYSGAMNVARRNADINGVSDRMDFILGDVTGDVFEKGDMFDLILTNPPYVTLDEYNDLGAEERHEPRHALTDEGDGLSIIRKILDIYPQHVKDGGALAIEIGYMQGASLLSEAEARGLSCGILKDIEGRDRVAVIRKQKDIN